MSKPGRHQHTFTDQETSAIEFVPLARLEAAEARARTAEEALERIAHLRVTSGLAPEVARSALATIREGA